KIALSNVTASGNTNGTGAALNNSSATSPMSVTLSGDNTFDNNYNAGLQIGSIGAVTVNDVTASGNDTPHLGSYGVYIDNCQYGTTACTGKGTVALTGTNIFTANYGGGLYISSGGAIKASNLIASSNSHGFGANMDNSSAASPQSITLTGNNLFKYNYDTGLNVSSKGQITLNNITASYNSAGEGAFIANYYGAGGVTLTGGNTFNGNYGSGLEVDSHGALALSNITANDNGLIADSGFGVYLGNSGGTAKPVTLSGLNTMDHNYGNGLEVDSNGAVTLNSLTISDTVHGYGAYIDNCQWTPSACTGSGAVTLNGANAFNGNYVSGINISSNGAITLNNVTANGNGMGSSPGYGALLDNSQAAKQPVTVSGANSFNNNYSSGLDVTSKGAIKVNGTTADSNAITGAGYGYGLELDNCIWVTSACTGSGSVNLTGTNEMDANYYSGLNISTAGAVTINNLTANNSVAGTGFSLNLPGVQNITLTGTNVFNDNHYNGLDLATLGQITLNNVTANGNGNGTSGVGAELNNASGTKDVILTGVNVFNSNHGDGLDIDSLGNIKLNSLTANNNGVGLSIGFGVSVDDSGWNSLIYTGTGAVTLSGTSTFTGNYNYGFIATSVHAIKVNNITATDNGIAGTYGLGVNLDNSNASTPQAVTLSGTNTFNHNYGGGLHVLSKGTITAGSLIASDNTHGAGVELDNNYGATTSTAGVTLSGASLFNNNYYTGLKVSSYGAISINTSSLTADCNGLSGNCTVGVSGFGIYLDNSGNTSSTPPSITLKGTNNLNSNYSGGLYVVARGAVTLNSLTADSTAAGIGAYIQNSANGKGVTLSGTNVFNDNSYSGLNIVSNGAILLSNVTASNSQTGYGATMDNSGSAFLPRPSVTLTGTNVFRGNLLDGLNVTSAGAISVSNVTASGNKGSGLNLSNLSGSGGVTLSGVNNAVANTSYGVWIQTTGKVALTQLTADGNSNTGLLVSASGANVTLSCGSFTDNTGNGLNVSSTGTLTLIGVTASGNTATDILPGLSSWVVVRSCP
ncbi:MAG TPA: right-handed parallel beta-helix repeat-containing protein, partial [Anaerolineales bacterium]|nr:right-handed parallel beta-helix repeat-containing protein [Anaerolineales bacterium]